MTKYLQLGGDHLRPVVQQLCADYHAQDRARNLVLLRNFVAWGITRPEVGGINNIFNSVWMQETMRFAAEAKFNIHQPQDLTKDDVWGVFLVDAWYRKSNGMVVAQGRPKYDQQFFLERNAPPGVPNAPEVCPVWNDLLPYKSVTVVLPDSLEAEVVHWLEYVHGGGCVSKFMRLIGDRMAIRSDYRRW